MALDPGLEKVLFGRLVRAYERQLSRSGPGLYLDKSHPNIWIAEKLRGAFPQASFVGIERGPYATVASMMGHRGVLEWHRRWREFPVPNRFLGITKELAATYDDVPLAAQCTIRWAVHRDRMGELGRVLGNGLLVVSYESLVRDTERVLRELRQFLGLRGAIPEPAVRTDTLYKWRESLSDREILQIRGVVEA